MKNCEPNSFQSHFRCLYRSRGTRKGKKIASCLNASSRLYLLLITTMNNACLLRPTAHQLYLSKAEIFGLINVCPNVLVNGHPHNLYRLTNCVLLCTLLSGYWLKSRSRRHIWAEFAAGSLLCSETFFSGYSGFPLSLKTNTSKFQFDLERMDTFQRVLKNS